MNDVLTAFLYRLGVLIFYLRLDGCVRWLGRGSAKVLLYHDVEDRETDYTRGLACTTPPSRFRDHLAWLSRHYNVTSLEALLSGEVADRAVVITFDDGYHSVYRNAYPLLREFGMPAILYLISDAVDNKEMVWVNEINYALHLRPDETRAILHDVLGAPVAASAPDLISFCRTQYDPDAIGTIVSRIRSTLIGKSEAFAAMPQLYVSWDEVREMGGGGFSFGNHTVTHPNLERLDQARQYAEIAEAQRAITQEIGPISSLAYPFGHHDQHTAELAGRIGVTSIGEVGGQNRHLQPMAIGRTHLDDQSVAGLFARMEVVEPVKARLRALLS